MNHRFSTLAAALLAAVLALLAPTMQSGAPVSSIAAASDIGSLRALLVNGRKSTWSHNFAATGRIPSGATFTRASGRSCVDATLKIVQLGNNVPCIYVDPATGTPWGYLAETPSTNAITSSQALTGSGWTAAAATVTDSAVASPDGTTNASTIQENGTTAAHGNGWAATSVVNGSSYGLSAYVKNITGSRWFQLSIGGNGYINFQPSTGTIGTFNGVMSNVVASQLPNGWWRISGLFGAAGTSGAGVGLNLVPAGNSALSASYAGDGSSKIAVWGVQVDSAGVGVTSYIPTAGSTVTRSQDILSLPLTPLPGWNSSKGGVLVMTYRNHTFVPSVPGANQGIVRLDDGTDNNIVNPLSQYAGTGVLRHFIESGGMVQADLNAGPVVQAVFARRKLALGWGVPRSVSAIDGKFISGVNTATTLPTGLTTLWLGRSGAGQEMNGTLESIAYYAGARSDAFVQQVSR